MDLNTTEAGDAHTSPTCVNMLSKDGEEKSTIDKVFEDLERESESNEDVSRVGTIRDTNSVDAIKENLLQTNEPNSLHLKVENDVTSEIPARDLHKTKEDEHDSNLMLHIDINREKESIKTKDGIELADLLDVKSIHIDSSGRDNLLDINDSLVTDSMSVSSNVDNGDSSFSLTENVIPSSSENSFEVKGFKLDLNMQELANVFQNTDKVVNNSTAGEHMSGVDVSEGLSSFDHADMTQDFALDAPRVYCGYPVNHLDSLELEEGHSLDRAHFTTHDDGLTEPLRYVHNTDYSTGHCSDLSTMDEADLLAKYKQMEAQQELLNCSLISLSTHFAQVQLRLKQIINSPKQEQEALLKNLEKFTFIGIPEVNELCLYNYADGASKVRADETEKAANKSYIEDKLAFEKNKHKEMIGKLKTQLESLETYVYEFSNNDDAEIPTNQIMSKQQIIINELKEKLNLNVNLREDDQLREEINKSIIHPMKTKEDLILQLKTQISDLEKFINFLQSTQCKCSSEQGQVDMKNKTITIMKKISTILHIFAEHHSSGFKKPTTAAAMKKSMKVNHYGDLRAQLEIAINHVIDVCRQPPDQDLPIDSDYMSDTEDPVPCNSKVALAVRKQLAPTLQRLLQHGLVSLNSNQTVSVVQYISCASSANRQQASVHIWDLINKYYELKDGPDFNCKPNRKLSESFNLEIGSGSLGIKQSLLASIGNILSVHSKYKKFNKDSYFKSFVCDGLNKKTLVEWLHLILTYKTFCAEFYAPWSYVATTKFSDAAQSLRRLYEFHFSLTIVDVAIRNLQSIKDAF